MQPIATVRGWQVEQLRRPILILPYLLHHAPQEALTTCRDGADGWTVAEVMGHLYDFEAIFLQRVQITATQDKGELPFPNPNELVKAGNFNAQPLQPLIDGWIERRQQLIDFLSQRSVEDWDRIAKHPTRGLMSLADQLTLILWHDANHLEQIVKILNQA